MIFSQIILASEIIYEEELIYSKCNILDDDKAKALRNVPVKTITDIIEEIQIKSNLDKK